MQSLSVQALAQWHNEGRAFRLLDVRRQQAAVASGVQMGDAQWLNPALWLDWKDQVPDDLPVVLYCAHGREISQGLTAALAAMGRDAHYVEGGFAAWQQQGLPVQALQVNTPE